MALLFEQYEAPKGLTCLTCEQRSCGTTKTIYIDGKDIRREVKKS